MRQIVLDTETTGLETAQGHRIIEIGCVEMVNRRLSGRTFHHYLQPDRDIDAGAQEVHGISAADLADKPRFRDIADEFLAFVKGAELIIHNAPFDMGFLNNEFKLLERGDGFLDGHCKVLDTLTMARKKHPGQKNSLDALCKRYEIDNSQRELHGALLDAEILADVYLIMTGGQTALSLGSAEEDASVAGNTARLINRDKLPLTVVAATEEERAAHVAFLETIQKASGQCVWNEFEK